MRNVYKKILDALQDDYGLTKEELVDRTGYSYDGLRGRISEMRKLGYVIEYEKVPELREVMVKKYVLKNNKQKKLLDFLEKNGLFGQLLNIDIVAKKIGLTIDDVTGVIGKLFLNPHYSVIQLSNTQVKINRILMTYEKRTI